MKPILTNQQMQQADRYAIEQLQIPSLALMESAGRAVAEIAERMLSNKTYPSNQTKRTLILCGTGNNGGDGFVVARHLMNKGYEVWIRIVGDKQRIQNDALAMMIPLVRIREQRGIKDQGEIEELNESEIKPLSYIRFDLVVDAIYGTGLTGELRYDGKMGIGLLQRLRKEKVPILAVDIPSGLSGDNGQVISQCAGADTTVTFAARKIGHLLEPGRSLCGKVIVHDIGIPDKILHSVASAYECESSDVETIFSPLPADAHKGTRGKVFLLAGSIGLTGAATLTANAAVHTGAGLVTLGTPESAEVSIVPKLNSAMTFPLPERDGKIDESAIPLLPQWSTWADAWAIGPGLGRSNSVTQVVKQIYENVRLPIVVDADAIYALSKIKDANGILPPASDVRILTPHNGEFALLLGGDTQSIEANRFSAAQNYAKIQNVILVLKGSPTIITTPEGKIYLNPTGNYALASGGSGDVLTGMMVAILARMKSQPNFQPEMAAVAACFLHGKIADVWVESGKRPEFFHPQVLLDEMQNTLLNKPS